MSLPAVYSYMHRSVVTDNANDKLPTDGYECDVRVGVVSSCVVSQYCHCLLCTLTYTDLL